MMSFKQRINLKFLVQLGKTATERFKLFQEVYKSTMSRTWIFECHKRFKERRENMEDDPRSRRPTTSRRNENIVVDLKEKQAVVHFKFLIFILF